ncbi:hypothetical protein CWI38_0066p0030 [Hamiltosporidium tvaerminnensis]|uniref:Reverse transcriptase n=2 Tax=Hamiltosporidium tvaerminnensis TaxID=1176355 RepID=A0A4Q9M2Q4_9MICR|nr:hypothetical protein CWI38_0066p0030 [Hamiltosporidium tvaerminnensis]
MLFFGQLCFNNPLSESIIVENEASTMVPIIDIDPDIVLFEENAGDTQLILEITSDVHEEFTETVTTKTTIIADDFGSDSKIHQPTRGKPQCTYYSKGNRLIVLHSILDSATDVEQVWPGSAILAVQKGYYNEELVVLQEENTQRHRIATFLLDPCFLTDIILYINLRKCLCKEIEDGVVRTRKLQSEYAECHVPKDVSDAARIIQSIQVCYDESTSKESIESKISKILCFIDLLEKTVRQEKVSSSQKKKRITMYKSRKQLGKGNRMFELLRDRFYRGLSERVESEHLISLICLEETPQAGWYYCELTYLIFKGTPRTGSDYRLITCMLNMYKLTKNILLKVFISKLNIYISVRPEKTLSKKIDREILQGDSMSPSLFVLCMDLLSRKLNEKYTKTSLVIDDGRYDEIYAQYRGKLYKEKHCNFLEGICVYKYLGIERIAEKFPKENFATQNNLKKLFFAINQNVKSLINYHIKELRSESSDFSKCDEALYFMLEIGRDLLGMGSNSKEELTLKNFEEAQLEKLYYEIDKRKLHSKLYNVRNNELLRVSDSSGEVESELKAKESWGNASVGVFKRAEMHEEPTLPLKQASNDEECVKHLKTKNIPLVITGRTMYGEPMINISEELDLEEETVGIKSIHLEFNNNSRRMIDSKVCKGMNVSSSFFSDKKIHKYTRRAPDRATSNETDHFLINSRYGSSVMNVQNSRSADIDADHFLVMMKYRQCIVILKIIKNPKSQ